VGAKVYLLRPVSPEGEYGKAILAATTSHFFLNVLLQACYFAGSFVYHEEPINVGFKKFKFLKLTHDWRCNLAPCVYLSTLRVGNVIVLPQLSFSGEEPSRLFVISKC
jgi:hypothetical protein